MSMTRCCTCHICLSRVMRVTAVQLHKPSVALHSTSASRTSCFSWLVA